MTPLHRWVLLATLLGWASSVPVHEAENACVIPCYVSKGLPEACNEEELGLQSYGSDVEALIVHTLCRYPCDSVCRFSWQITAHRRGCDCTRFTDPKRPLIVTGTEDLPWLDPTMRDIHAISRSHGKRILEESLIERDKIDGRNDIMKDLRKSIVLGARTVEEGKEIDGSDAIVMRLKPRSDPEVYGIEYGGYAQDLSGKQDGKNNQTDTSSKPNSSEEESVDWNLWCMAQCYNGQGGSACKCDIIP